MFQLRGRPGCCLVCCHVRFSLGSTLSWQGPHWWKNNPASSNDWRDLSSPKQNCLFSNTAVLNQKSQPQPVDVSLFFFKTLWLSKWEIGKRCRNFFFVIESSKVIVHAVSWDASVISVTMKIRDEVDSSFRYTKKHSNETDTQPSNLSSRAVKVGEN